MSWNTINKGILVETSNQCFIGILKWQLTWDREILLMRHLYWDDGVSIYQNDYQLRIWEQFNIIK